MDPARAIFKYSIRYALGSKLYQTALCKFKILSHKRISVIGANFEL